MTPYLCPACRLDATREWAGWHFNRKRAAGWNRDKAQAWTEFLIVEASTDWTHEYVETVVRRMALADALPASEALARLQRMAAAGAIPPALQPHAGAP
jgi:hypothetical protein